MHTFSNVMSHNEQGLMVATEESISSQKDFLNDCCRYQIAQNGERFTDSEPPREEVEGIDFPGNLVSLFEADNDFI